VFIYFLQGATLGLSASATPGPFQAFLLSQTLKNGWRHTLPAAMAPLLSDGPIVFFVLLILTQTSNQLLDILRIAGGLFILYLAYGAIKSIRQPTAPAAIKPGSLRRNVLNGALMNALSPGPYIFWSVLAGPIVLESWRQSPLWSLSFVLGFYGTLIGGFAAFVILFATTSQFGPRFRYMLNIIAAVALLIFGVYQLWTGAANFMG
jgi:threonine/homoserine/homoserine lactone efflux protein